MPKHKFFVFASLCCALFLPGQVVANSQEVAPGITLPSTGTVYSVDLVQQKLSLVQVHPTEISANTHAGSNFARGMVYSGPHSSMELKGISSAATLHTAEAVFYVRLGSEDPEILRNRVKLIQQKPVKDRRMVSDFSMNVFGGQRKQRYQEVPVEKSDVPGGVWLKLVPQKPLAPGEYGIVFMPKDPNFFADYVYDFSIADTEKKPNSAGN
jgi:hypothetical protein